MSAELLRREAALMREQAEAASPAPWAVNIEHGRDYTDEAWSNTDVTAADGKSAAWYCDEQEGVENAVHIASWHPDVALAVADLLDRAAEHHRSESVDDLYLWDCDECPEGDCAGHTRDCCWGCVAQDEDGQAGRVFYPCGEMTAALAVARAFLRRDA